MDSRNIWNEAIDNTDYRRVIKTTKQVQRVLMSLDRGEDIPTEVHPGVTQIIDIIKGEGLATIGKTKVTLSPGVSITIPPGRKHHVQQCGFAPLKLHTLYIPPEHPKGKVNERQPK